MRRRESALLYTVEASARSMADLTDDLGAAGLFVYDHFEESESGRHVSVLERPELSKLFVDAALSAVRASKDAGKRPHVVVVEQIDDLGPSDLERTAVVGAILEMGCAIRAAGMALPSRWYQQQVLVHGFHTSPR